MNGIEVILALLGGGIAVFFTVVRRTDPAQRTFRDYARRQGLSPADAGDRVDVINRGRRVQIRLVQAPDLASWWIDVRANVLIRPGLRLVRRRHWQGRPVPHDLEPEIWSLPVVREDEGSQIRTDRPDALDDLDELEVAWRIVEANVPHVVLAADGAHVACRVEGVHLSFDVVEAMIDAVAIVARWDDGLSRTLADLAGAAPRVTDDLDPSVLLAPDNLRLGVWKGIVSVAHLAGIRAAPATARVQSGAVAVSAGALPVGALLLLGRAGDGELLIEPDSARYTWREIERDPARLRAGIDALRAATGAALAPYR